MSNIIDFPKQDLPDIKGPERTGNSVIIDGRCVPKMHMHDRGETVDFILDGRLSFEFPKDMAYLAASFAANAMAIGAGYTFLGSETKDHPFAPQCFQIDLSDEADPTP